MEFVRLDKYLANAGIGTRTEVKNHIKNGRVKVNGICASRPETKLCTETDQVLFDEKVISLQKFEYYLFHKPAGCVTANHDNMHQTVMDFITSARKEDLFPVGRLDLDTEGLLIITNDGELAHRLLSPRRHVDKTYQVLIEGMITEEDVQAFTEGIDIGDEKMTLPAKLSIMTADLRSEVLVTIREGRYHQVKRMFEALGKQVLYLKRTEMGGLHLDINLQKGDFRPLTEKEVHLLMKCAGLEQTREEN